MNILKSLVTAAATLGLLTGPSANAAKPAPAKSAPLKPAPTAASRTAGKGKSAKAAPPVFGFARVLVKRGVLPAADLTRLQGFKTRIGACFREAKAALPKPRCHKLRKKLPPVQQAALEKTLADLVGEKDVQLVKACFRPAKLREDVSPKARCRTLRKDFLAEQKSVYQKALVKLDQVKDATLVAKTKKFLGWLSKSAARVGAKLAAESTAKGTAKSPANSPAKSK